MSFAFEDTYYEKYKFTVCDYIALVLFCSWFFLMLSLAFYPAFRDANLRHCLSEINKNNKECLNHYSNGALFIEACSYDNLEVVNIIIEENRLNNDIYVSVTQRGLETASMRGSLNIVKYLVKKGVDPCHSKSYSLQLAIEYKRGDIIQFLIETGCK